MVDALSISEIDSKLEEVRTLRRSDIQTAFRKASELLEITRTVGYKAGQSRAHYESAACLSFLSRLDEARTHLQRALELTCESDDVRQRRHLLIGLAVVEKNSGNLDVALNLLKEVTEAEIIDDATALANNNAASIYYDLGDFVSGADHINKAFHAAVELGDVRSRIQAVIGLALLQIEIHSDVEALKLLEAELDNVDNTLLDLQCQLLAPITNILSTLGRIDEAKKSYARLEKLARQHKNDFMLQQVEAAYCTLLFADGRYSEAVKILESTYQTTRYPECKVNAMIELTSGFVNLGRFEEALSICAQFENVNLRRREKLKVLTNQARALTALGQHERANTSYEQVLSAESKLLLEQTRFKVSSINVLLMILQIKNESQLQQLRASQLEETLSLTTSALVAQTDLLAKFRDDIRMLVRKLPPTEPVVKELKEKLKALPCESVDWERFDAQFKAAHPEFVKNLTTTHTELTSMEVRICSLLRSSLKSQDIGRLLCLSDRTVENHRFNIRKKLALARSVDLKVYLQRF